MTLGHSVQKVHFVLSCDAGLCNRRGPLVAGQQPSTVRGQPRVAFEAHFVDRTGAAPGTSFAEGRRGCGGMAGECRHTIAGAAQCEKYVVLKRRSRF
jgi:hypothetical protein